MKPPPIDVVIPLYNGSRSIGGLLDALRAQSCSPRTVTVVDDGSTDDSPAIVERYNEVTLLRNPQKGANPARVFGLAQGDAPYVALIDQDDVPLPEHFAVLSRALDEHPDCAAVLGASAPRVAPKTVPGEAAADLVPFDPWIDFPVYISESPSAGLIRRDALDAVGGWCTRFVGVADTYAWLRLSERSPLLKTRTPTWRRGDLAESYSRTLRLENAEKYLAKRALASADAMEHRIRLYPDEATSLRQRFEVMARVADVLKAVRDQNHDAIRVSALALETCVAREHAPFADQACQTLVWFLATALDDGPPPARRVVLHALVDDWPTAARVTQRNLRDIVDKVLPAGVQLRYLLAGPTRLARWQLLTRMMQSRLRRRIGLA